MTALAGYWAFGAGAEPRASCEKMLRAQSVYAPEAPAIRAEGKVAIGRRLFRTLPEDASDVGPVVGGGGRWTLVADVRLDDRAGLCESLGIDARGAVKLPDSALVMRAIERWEEQAFARLVGEFAIASWDSRRERLLLARDFLGQRPLHYHCGAGFLAFASMPKGLLALPEVPRGPDATAMAEFLALRPETSSRSFFQGVERVLPGECCVFTAGGLVRQRNWSFEPQTLRLRSAGDYAEAVRETFDRAVEARLRGSGGRVGAHLSGGLDSSTVAATAARLLAEEGSVVAFTSVPREGYAAQLDHGRFADESGHAAAVAALYPNMEHVLVRTGARSPFANLGRQFLLNQRPVLNLCNTVWTDAIADEARRRGLKVMLTGQMGNMSFSYTGLEALPGLLAQGRLLRLAREAFALRRGGLRGRSVASHTIGPFLPEWLWSAVNRAAGRRLRTSDHSALGPEAAARLASDGQRSGFRPHRDAVAARLLALGQTDLGNYRHGRLGGWGIDMRDPTADRRLVELCLSIPAEAYIAGGKSRALARRAFADRLPPEVLNETRKGYQAADWHEGLEGAWDEARAEVEAAAAVPLVRSLVDTEKLRDLLKEVPAGNWNAPKVVASYRLALLRGISAAHFMREALGSDAPGDLAR